MKKFQRIPTGPVGGLMDSRFQYTTAAATDIRKTFERIKAQMAADAEAQATNVLPLPTTKKAKQ